MCHQPRWALEIGAPPPCVDSGSCAINYAIPSPPSNPSIQSNDSNIHKDLWAMAKATKNLIDRSPHPTPRPPTPTPNKRSRLIRRKTTNETKQNNVHHDKEDDDDDDDVVAVGPSPCDPAKRQGAAKPPCGRPRAYHTTWPATRRRGVDRINLFGIGGPKMDPTWI